MAKKIVKKTARKASGKAPAGKAKKTARRPAPEAAEEGGDVKVYAGWAVRILIFGALAIAAWTIVPPYLKAHKAQAKWQEAVNASNAGEYDAAIRLYDEARAIAPDFETLQEKYPVEAAKAYIGKARDLEQKGQSLAAGDAYAKAGELDPEGARKEDAFYLAAQCYFLAKDKAKARDLARKAVEASGGTHSRAQKMLDSLSK